MELIIGLLIGAAIGATGVGGGTLTAPALILLMGYQPRTAVATALIFSAVVKIWASGVYLARRQVDFSILWRLLAGGLPGTILGAFALQGLRTSQANQWILLAVGVTVAISALVNLMNIRKRDRESGTRPNWIPVLSLPIGLESGFSSPAPVLSARFCSSISQPLRRPWW